MSSKPKILITSALPYANGPLHFGHIAGAYLPADAYARFQRLMGHDVLYICGSDEYGFPITLSAEAAKRAPKEQADIYHQINKAFFEKLSFSFDHYGRTTNRHHAPIVQQYFTDLRENGYIEEKVTDQLYSEKEGRFLADRYVVGTCPKCGFEEARGDECPSCGGSFESTDLNHPRSKLTNAPLTKKATKHWFLKFDAFKEPLKEWLSSKQWKPNVLNFAKSYARELKPRGITRDSTWGVPIPLEGTDGKVFYVWFDAPIGYLSISAEWAELQGKPEAWKDYWCNETTRLIHFVGKDNIPFHSVFFPAMTMGQNQPYKLVDDLPANEFLNLEGKQFSKSEGWTIDLDRFFQNFTPDQIRFYLAANAPETQDADFSWKEFQLSCNSMLLGKYGNLANRTLVFAHKHCNGKVPTAVLQEEDKAFIEAARNIADKARDAYTSYSLRRATQSIMELASLGNVYFDAKKPWTNKDDPTPIHCCIYVLHLLALISSPIIPKTAQTLWELLGNTTQLETLNWNTLMEEKLKSDIPLPEPKPLFNKVEDEVIEREEALLKPAEPISPFKDEITFDTFMKLDLRVGQILTVEKVEKSKKLLKLSVDLGFEKRTIVSGISTYFEDPQLLVGRKVIVVANLKPAKLMGIESQGMVLAASLKEDGLELPSLQDAEPGDPIT